MHTESFDKVFRDVQGYLGRGLKLPRYNLPGISWDAHHDDTQGVFVLSVKLPLAALHQNLQVDQSAVPAFLLCLAYWLEKLNGERGASLRFRCNIEVKDAGESSSPDKALSVHLWRSLFLLKEYSRLFPERFSYNLPKSLDGWRWPTMPIFNRPSRRPKEGARPLPLDPNESDIERYMAENPKLMSSFPVKGPSAPGTLHRQLPIGLFEGHVSRDLAVTPRNKSQVDLWSLSEDGTVLHLFELKDECNSKVGIVPEAFYYARMLGYARNGYVCPWGRCVKWEGVKHESEIPDMSSVRDVVMWLTVSCMHPLVRSPKGSPLEWFNELLAPDHIRFRIVDYVVDRQRLQTGDDIPIAWRGVWP